MINLSLDTEAGVSKASFIKEIGEDRFEQEVLTASMKLPVIVSFVTAKNPLCEEILATLEKSVSSFNGKIILLKIDINKNPALAQAMQLETVPTIYGFFQGKPVDGFAGKKTAAEVSSFVEKINKLYAGDDDDNSSMSVEELKKTLDEADVFFQENNYDEAMVDYNIVLEADSKNMEALGGIGWCLISGGDKESVKEMLGNLTAAELKNPRLKGLSFILSMEEKSAELEGIDILEEKEDAQSLFDLSICYLVESRFKDVIDALIDIIKQDKNWEDKKANKFLLEIFEAFGEFHPLTSYGRRKLSAILFS